MPRLFYNAAKKNYKDGLMDKVYLILASGDVFEGTSIGAKGEAVGEVVFTTAMTGYLETITDPSYYGQIVVQTFPLIGNVGVIPEDFESSGIRLKGYIVRDLCEYPSNFRCKGSLGDFLKEQGVIGIQGIDTRHLTKIVRERGVMNGIITSSPKLTAAQKKALEEYSIKGAVQETSCKKSYVVPAKGEKKFRVALVDYGSKSNIERELVARGCEITVFPCSRKAEDILKGGFDGIMLTNGPGDPAENVFEIEQVKKLMAGGLPVFGICLGHQLMALAQGAKTVKLKYGHRGGNQPAKEVGADRIYITSQNHGYAVDGDTLPADKGYVSFVNANDGTCEGINYTCCNAFSVQFHPEACAGPLDTQFLFDRFIEKMEEK